ncbi:homeobox even-skipped homolog protein 2-like [Mustela lutreola]|uniref:homeobox even-skipped homolog protein 2-like n=1 Tax=Mustela lutreola TaxID=9666 RepID=UPI0027975AF0|nr:homeobox even-skipped homolog protein 2-like [Mustela lutreola]
MRALSQKPVTLRGARPHPRAHACASQGFPACARCQSRSGACARYLRPTRVAGFPLLQAPAPHHPLPAPSQPVPFLSSRNGAGAARGRAPGTRLALGLALSATAPLAPPRALAQSVAPKAPLSSGGGGGSCFRFFLSFQSGVASSTQPPLPLPNGAAAAEGCGGGGGGGNWGRRRPPLLPPR